MTACAVVLFTSLASAQCPDLLSSLGRPGVSGGIGALLSFDDGTGPALYAGGFFGTAGDVRAPRAARWREQRWSSIGFENLHPDFEPYAQVTSYAVFDSGSGPELYAAGQLPNGVARWNGNEWIPLPGAAYASAIIVFDDGNGPALYVNNGIAGTSANGIAKWDGSTWSALGSGLGGVATCFATFDDGTGPALYVGGAFTTAGGLSANGIAKWHGSTWSTLGSGMSGGAGSAAMTVFALLGASVGGGPARLYAAGRFTHAGGVVANSIASWDGAAWSPLGSGITSGVLGQPPIVHALEAFDDGTGARLYVGGTFTHAGGSAANSLARWDGASWSALPTQIDAFASTTHFVRALEVHDDGTGLALYVGGSFRTIGGEHVWNIARWTGSTWHPLGRGQGLDATVAALAAFDDGGGDALYVGGGVSGAGEVELRGIGRWRNGEWSPVGSGFAGVASSLLAFDDGSGDALYVGGGFTLGGSGAHHVAKWNGIAWSTLGEGISGSHVSALAVFDDGTGPALYAAGTFTQAGQTSANNIARWDGTSWSALGGGIVLSHPTTLPGIFALAVFDDGTGPALYVAGRFVQAGQTPANNIARWDGTSWSALGSGVTGPSPGLFSEYPQPGVFALHVFDDGGGGALYAGGVFDNAGGTAVRHVARWDGASWSAVGGRELSGGPETGVFELGVFDDTLVAGGTFGVSHGASLARLAGTTWRSLGGAFRENDSELWASVRALATFDDGSGLGPQLYVGGHFLAVGAKASHYLARLSCIGVTVPYCFGSDSASANCPCANESAQATGCLNSQNTGAQLRASGSIRLSDDDLVLSASGMTGTAALFFQGTLAAGFGAGVFHGDGLMCVGGSLVRLRTQSNVNGASSYPGLGDPSVSVTGNVAAPSTRTYQVVYRDATGVCTPNAINLTNAVQVGWTL